MAALKYKIILASASRRRSKILKECGIPHRVVVSNVPEKMEHEKGAEYNVRHNARAKAEKAAQRDKQGLIIGADTVVLLGRRIIGKPRNKKEARAFLKAFSGKTILVYTGLCVIDAEKRKSAEGVDVTKVHVRRLSSAEIAGFVAAFAHTDKAGGFSIEGRGAFIFDNIEGSFYNVLGLPLVKLNELFAELGVDLCGESYERIG